MHTIFVRQNRICPMSVGLGLFSRFIVGTVRTTPIAMKTRVSISEKRSFYRSSRVHAHCELVVASVATSGKRHILTTRPPPWSSSTCHLALFAKGTLQTPPTGDRRRDRRLVLDDRTAHFSPQLVSQGGRTKQTPPCAGSGALLCPRRRPRQALAMETTRRRGPAPVRRCSRKWPA